MYRGFTIMPMQAESLEVLEKADVPPVQARAIVRAIEIELAGAADTLATKHMALLGQMAVLLGIAYFFVTNVVR